MEEHQALWMTNPHWFDETKKCLIHYGYIIEQLQRVIDIFNGHKLPCEIDHHFI